MLEQVRLRGAELRAGLADLRGEFSVITELRGRGLMQGVRLARGAEELQKSLYAHALSMGIVKGEDAVGETKKEAPPADLGAYRAKKRGAA